MTHRNLDGRDSLRGLDDWITREPPLQEDRETEEPIPPGIVTTYEPKPIPLRQFD